MMREVILHGALGVKYGERYRVDVKTVQEAVHALTCQIKGIYRSILDGEFQVIADEGMYFDESEIMLDLGDVQRVHIVPVPAGSKRGGVLKVILGIALIGVGFAIGVGNTIGGGLLAGMSGKSFLMLGAGFLLNGIGQMMSPSPMLESHEKPNDRPSYLFSSPLNIAEEGNCLPVAYGSPFCSTLVASSGYNTEGVDLSLDNVTGLKAVPRPGKLKISWNPVAGAADYLLEIKGPVNWTLKSKTTEYLKWPLPVGDYDLSVIARNGELKSKKATTLKASVTEAFPKRPDHDGGRDGRDD